MSTEIKTVIIAGSEYPACFSGRALKYVATKYGNMNGMVENIDDSIQNLTEDQVDVIYTLLWHIINSGMKKAKKMGLEFPTLEEDEIWDLVGADEFPRIWSSIADIMEFDTTPNVNIESPNVEATQTPEM